MAIARLKESINAVSLAVLVYFQQFGWRIAELFFEGK